MYSISSLHKVCCLPCSDTYIACLLLGMHYQVFHQGLGIGKIWPAVRMIFAQLVGSEERFSYKEVQLKKFCLLKPVALLLKTLMKSLCSITGSLVYISLGMNERMTAWNWWVNKWMIEEVVGDVWLGEQNERTKINEQTKINWWTFYVHVHYT